MSSRHSLLRPVGALALLLCLTGQASAAGKLAEMAALAEYSPYKRAREGSSFVKKITKRPYPVCQDPSRRAGRKNKSLLLLFFRKRL
jgi:hypothetical protein